MANQLKVVKVHAILTLHEQGWSYRRIARELGIRRETVSRHIRLAESVAKPATVDQAPPGSVDSKPARALAGSSPPNTADLPCIAIGVETDGGSPNSASNCQLYRQQILAKLEQGLTAKRIHQDLQGDQGDQSPSYYSVLRFVRRLQGRRSLPFRRMECEPAAEAQVDFGTSAPVTQPNGKRRRPHVLRIVLSHSRKAYSEVVWRQTTENFIQCLENAFWNWGGSPKILVLDNLRAAVSKADWFDPEINPKVQSFCKHYGIVPLPTKPRMPRHKGKIERGIDYVKNNALKGHVFTSLEQENRHLQDWERSVADTRIHGTTRQQVIKVFQEVERPALKPLPATRFPFFHEAQRSVHRDGHVEVDKAYYSVPPEYLGRRLWVRWDSRLVRVFNNQMVQIAIHMKQESGRFSTQSIHIASKKIHGVERGAAHLMSKIRIIGPQAGRWSEAMIQARGIEGVRVLMGLLSLANRHPCEEIERACEIAVSHGAYRLRSIRQLINRHTPKQSQFEFIDEHPIIRSLSDYGQLVHNAITKETCT